jgi:hypothetical protein
MIIEYGGKTYGSFEYQASPKENGDKPNEEIDEWYDWRELVYIMARDYY